MDQHSSGCPPNTARGNDTFDSDQNHLNWVRSIAHSRRDDIVTLGELTIVLQGRSNSKHPQHRYSKVVESKLQQMHEFLSCSTESGAHQEPINFIGMILVKFQII